MSWLHHLLIESSVALERTDKAAFQFNRTIAEGLGKYPIQPWELDLWARGLKTGLIRLEGYFFRVGAGKRSPLSFFVRNDREIYVGLRRESITQAATYVQLITDYGYPRSQVRFESRWMDVAVYDLAGHAFIYAENKANDKTLDKLCGRLSREFLDDIPPVNLASAVVDDVLMKAHHIWRNRPAYFWGVSPNRRVPFRVRYQRSRGFALEAMETLPNSLEELGLYAPLAN